MGGYGSGRKQEKRATVEDCLVLSMRPLLKLIEAGPGPAGTVTWSSGGQKRAEISVAFENVDGWSFLRFHYAMGSGEVKRDMSYLVEVVPVTLPSGGRKWYFLCPGHSGTCRRRCSKLYLGAGSSVFACRECHDLTYTSRRESRKWDSLYRRLASSMGGDFSPSDIKRIMRRP